MITLVINGQARQLRSPMTVAEYLRSLGIDRQFIAVARNGDVVEREEFDRVTLEEGDRVEIVRPVAGG